MARISLEGMRFYAYHGCFEEERRVGTRFELSCELEYDASSAEETDDLSKAIDYQQVYAIIKQEMEIPSKLLEHVARRIVVHLRGSFPQVESVKIKISKMQPPLGGNIDKVSVTLRG